LQRGAINESGPIILAGCGALFMLPPAPLSGTDSRRAARPAGQFPTTFEVVMNNNITAPLPTCLPNGNATYALFPLLGDNTSVALMYDEIKNGDTDPGWVRGSAPAAATPLTRWLAAGFVLHRAVHERERDSLAGRARPRPRLPHGSRVAPPQVPHLRGQIHSVTPGEAGFVPSHGRCY